MSKEELIKTKTQIEVKRYIRWYEHAGDKYLGEYQLEIATLEDLQKLVGNEVDKEDELLYGCYALSKEQMDLLFAGTAVCWEHGEFDYYLEATRIYKVEIKPMKKWWQFWKSDAKEASKYMKKLREELIIKHDAATPTDDYYLPVDNK